MRRGFLACALALLAAIACSSELRGQAKDADQDGIPDDWERLGFIDIQWPNGQPQRLDLTRDGPVSADHKDVFVLVAWMQDQTHTHKPDAKALQIVRDAFAAAPVSNPDGLTGIRLHIYLAPTAVAEKAQIGKMLPSGEYDWTEFDQIKKTVFPPKLRGVFHFCLFAHDIDAAHYSGVARTMPGRDFIVSLGAFGPNHVGDVQSQAGTFMHELGHDLGLHHGGNDDINNKPNYISVMNYSFQLDGIPIDGVPGNYDYSRFAADINENHLNENLGLNVAPDLARYGTQYFCASSPDHSQPAASIAQAIDWNCNNTIENDVSADINLDGQLTVLTGFNDWQGILLTFGAPGAGKPNLTPVKLQHELTLTKANAMTLLPVAHLEATRIVGGVKLAWGKIPLDRILAYRVFRAASPNGQSGLLASTETPDFVDKSVAEGSYSYTITAVYAPRGNVTPTPFSDSDLGQLVTHTDAVAEVMGTARASTEKMATLGQRSGHAKVPNWAVLLETPKSAKATVEIK